MVTSDNFVEQIEELANAYAFDTVVDPTVHPDAVECVKQDYIEGAYELLTGEEL